MKRIFKDVVIFILLAVLVVIIAAAATRACACEPDLVVHTPTPTLGWDRVLDEDLAGYWLWYRMPGGTFQRACQLPVQRWPETDENGDPTGVILVFHRGVDLDAAIQRCLEGYELELLEWAATAYDAVGNESVSYSNVVEVCMPEIWSPGEVYR